MTRKITIFVMLAIGCALIGYDIYAVAKGPEFSITYRIRTVSKDFEIIPCGLGFLMGYWLKGASTYLKGKQ